MILTFLQPTIDRVFILVLGILTATWSMWSGIPAAQRPATTGAVVDAQYSGVDGVVVEGTKRYRTIRAALQDAPDDPAGPHVIRIKPSRYYEKITVTKPNIAFVGEGRDKTILTFDAFSGQRMPDGTNLGTWKCSTLIIQAPDFRAENMTIENDWDYPANDAKYADDPTRTSAPQAVALMTDQGSDRALFRNLKISGYQDTLFVSSGRSYFTECVISGHVDFIFGAGQAVFEEDDIITRARRVHGSSPVGYVTAPSTAISRRYGLVFLRCRLLKESPAVPKNSSPLGRPWHPTANFPDGRYADPDAIGMSIFINCYMDDHITEKGWDQMAGTGRKAGERTWFRPEDARFFEFGSTGPGAAKNAERRQLSESESKEYTVEKVLDGWHP